jgi:Putative transposase/Transposase zinc-binding domain
MVAVTLQDVLNSAYPAYAATRRLPLHVLKAASALRRCRTGALGHHAVECTAGHLVDLRRNSCRHRACPQCGWSKAAQWLERWQARLLPSAHFHVIFTLPHQLHLLWRWNRRRFAAAFFQAVRDTLFQLLEQERHLGARPGVLMGLHTWGGALPLHVHLHCLVTAGGVDADGRWRASRPNFLLWGPSVRTVFRAKMLASLEQLLAQRRLLLPPDLGEAGVRALLRETTRTPWHVRIEPPYAHGRGLVVYLARYLRGGPIKNHRLVAFTEEGVCFRHREQRAAGRAKWRTLTLPVEEFLDRLFEHVPVTGLHMVRAYGLYSGRARAARESCRFQIEPRWRQPPPGPSVPAADAERCPRCGAPLITVVLAATRPRSRADEKPTGPGPPPGGMFN